MMETLVVVSQHKNQYCSRSKPNGSAKLGSSPAKDLRDINCITFQSGYGILPTPLKACTTPVAAKSRVNPNSDGTKHFTRSVKAISLPIDIKGCNKERYFSEEFSFSERWAGPAYSNSPPPSSLPIPKFSLRQKRSVSLDLPGSVHVVKIHPIAKSAPPSPTRESYPSSKDLFHNADSATMTLRRILNLNITDE